MTTRKIERIIEGRLSSDGAGVKLTRSLGRSQQLRVDPFLMLDAFATDEAADYIGGFPPHPHRGFETVTYMLNGRMQHEDHMGNKGELSDGGVQWMTAGRGVIHSEMPQQTEGRMQGFQLWVNLPAAEKMKPAAYRDIPAADIPAVALDSGVEIKIIAGVLQIDGQTHEGPLNNSASRISTDPSYLDVYLPQGETLSLPITTGYNAFVYPYQGEIEVEGQRLLPNQAGVTSEGDSLSMTATQESRLLVLAGKPLNEPIAQYGPFVMNTMEEVEQAIQDYQNGTLTEAA